MVDAFQWFYVCRSLVQSNSKRPLGSNDVQLLRCDVTLDKMLVEIGWDGMNLT